MPYAVNLIYGTVDLSSAPRLIIGYAKMFEDDHWQLPVVQDIDRFHQLCAEQSVTTEDTEVFEQFPGGDWRLPQREIEVPPRDT